MKAKLIRTQIFSFAFGLSFLLLFSLINVKADTTTSAPSSSDNRISGGYSHCISSASSGSGTASAAAASGGGSTELRYRPRSYYEEYGCRRGYGGCGYNGYGGNALYGFDNYYPFDSYGYGPGYGRGSYGGYGHGGYLRDGEYGHGEYKRNKYGEVRNGYDLGYGGYGKYSDRRGYGGHGGYGDRHYDARYNDVFQDRYFYPFPVYDYSFDRYYYDRRLGSFRDHYYPFGYAYGNGFRHGYQ